MHKIACLGIFIVAASPLWSQVQPSGSGGSAGLGDSRMMTPAPVGGNAYPSGVGSQERSNYIAGGVVFTGAYVDNLVGSTGTSTTSDETYAFLPTISYDRKTPRQGESLSYSAGFTIYQHGTEPNSVAQSASGSYQFRITKYAVLVLGDSFQQNNNVYNQGNPFTGGATPGSPGQPNLISPFQNQLSNTSSGGIHYQYARNAMIGGSGSYSLQQFSESASGLNNEGTAGASGFFSRRIAGSHYVGVRYQFSKFVTHPIDTYTLTHILFGFYTHYFTPSFSFSVLGGPEHYITWGSGAPSQSAWTPAVQGSFGWQTPLTNVTASYSHIVSGAGGLIGTYRSDLIGLSGRRALSRTWDIGANVNYSLYDNVNTSAATVYGTGGNGIFGGVYVDHRFTERFNGQFGYSHFHQDYADIPSASNSPDSNRVYVSIMYGFNRPLGR